MNVTKRKLLILIKNSTAFSSVSHKLLVYSIKETVVKDDVSTPWCVEINQRSYLKLRIFSTTTNNAN